MGTWRAAAAILLVVLFSGCERQSTTTTPSTSKPAPTSTTALSPTINPERAKAGTAEREVLRMLRYLQLDLSPLALELYDAQVIRTLGKDVTSGALRSQAPALAKAGLTRVASERSALGTVVVVDLKFEDTPEQAGQRYSFLLRKRGAKWSIVYDSLLQHALVFYIEERDKARTGSKTPSRRASEAARRIADRYEDVALQGREFPAPGG